MRREVILIAVTGGFCSACFDPPPAAEGPFVESHVATYWYPEHPPPQLDLLFVVDNTTAMAPYADRVPELAMTAAAALAEIGHGMADIQIGATSNGGVLSPIVSDHVDWNGVHTSSFSGSLGDALASITAVGSTGSGPSQPLAAIHDALAAPQNLVRPGAYLSVVTLTATDDGSPAFDYVAFLKNVKSDPAKVLVSGIYPQPSANLDSFHQSFPNRNTIISIDSTDYTEAFQMLRQVQRSTLELPCFDVTLLDLDPATPGTQPDCDVRALDENLVEFAGVEMCEGSADPASGTCWQVEPNPGCGTDMTFRLRGVWATYRPAIRVECVTSP